MVLHCRGDAARSVLTEGGVRVEGGLLVGVLAVAQGGVQGEGDAEGGGGLPLCRICEGEVGSRMGWVGGWMGV